MMSSSSPPKEPVISGPHSLFDDSFIVEFLEPDPSRNATVLLRATYKAASPLCKLGPKHPQSPPLHLHMEQYESFEVLQGSVTTISGYSLESEIHTPSSGTRTLPPWLPHTFHPTANNASDSTMLMWAHPDSTSSPMDRVFFENLLRYLSDVHEGRAKLDLLQVMLMQHLTASTLVVLPGATWLGGLRWWLPWKLQALLAWVAVRLGRQMVMERYTRREDWEAYSKAKKD